MNIYEKLGVIQSKLKAPKGQYNSFGKYKYRSCEDILEAVKPLLAETKTVLCITDQMEVVGDRIYVRAETHLKDAEDSSSEIVTVAYAREEESKKGMDSSQVTGAASSYARKYALNGLFCIDDNTGKYEATVTAPNKSSYSQSGHYYGITIKATDDAGNVTTKDATDSAIGSSLRLTVKEKVAPVITVTNPTASATLVNNKPTITWTVTDDDSGVNPSTIGITIDSGSKITDGITKTAVTGGYNCSYIPATALTDGSHTIRFDASDYDGNAATQKSVTFKIDTVPPTLSVASPSDGYVTNKSTITVAGTTNDATSSPVTVMINGTPVTVGSNGAFSTTVTLSAGSNTITIVAKDSAGKTTTITRIVKYDPNPPKITAASVTPNPVDAGKTYVISVTVTDE